MPGAIYLALISLIPLIAFKLINANQNFPVRWHLHPHHRRCGVGTVKTDRGSAATAPLRRVPQVTPMMRLIIFGPRRGEGHAGLADRRALRHPRHLDRRHLPRQHQGRTPRSPSQGDPRQRGYVSDEITNAIVDDRLAQPDYGQASCWTAAPAPPIRCRRSRKFLAGRGSALGAVLS